MKPTFSVLGTLVVMVLLVVKTTAQQLVDPLDNTLLTPGESDCMKKLNWPKCGGWEYDKLNLTIETDPGYKRFEAEVCTRECMDMFKSLSDDYLKKVCGPNYEFPRNRRRRLPIVALNGVSKCDKDEAGALCSVLYDDVSKKFNFNATKLADELQQANPTPFILESDDDWKKIEAVVVPWSKYPKDYACSQCAQFDIERQTKIKAFRNGSYHDPHMDISAKGIAERKAMCTGWVAPKAAITTTKPSSSDRLVNGLFLGVFAALLGVASACL